MTETSGYATSGYFGIKLGGNRSMLEDDIHAALTKIFQTVFNRDGLVLTRSLTAKDVPGWDSFKQVDIILGVEERFGFEFSSREMDILNTLGDLLDIVAMKTMVL